MSMMTLLKMELDLAKNKIRLALVDVLTFVARRAINRSRKLLINVARNDKLWEDADND